MVNDVSDRGEQSCLSTRGFTVSTHHVFSFSIFSNVLARLAVIALWAKLSKIHNNKTQTFKLHLLFNRNILGNMLWVWGKRIFAVKRHISSSWKCDCHYYYHPSSKNLGNEPFHLGLPIPAIEAERSPLECRRVKKSSACCGSMDLHACKARDTECACCYVYRRLIPGLSVIEESKHPIKAICLSSYIF